MSIACCLGPENENPGLSSLFLMLSLKMASKCSSFPMPDKQIVHISSVVSGFLITTNFLCPTFTMHRYISDHRRCFGGCGGGGGCGCGCGCGGGAGGVLVVVVVWGTVSLY